MDLLNQDITVLRVTESGYNALGEYVVNERQQFTVKGRVTKKQGAREHNPELLGRDLQGSINVLTRDTPLKTIDTSELKKADIVVYDGAMYEVVADSGLQKIGTLKHYRYKANLIQVLDDSSTSPPISGNPFKAGRIDVYKNSELVANRPNLNFIDSDTISLSINDNNATDSIDIILEATSKNNFTEIVFNEDIEKLKVVTVDGFKANSNNLNHHNKILGISKSDTSQDHSGQVYYSGELFDLDISYPIGTNLFLNSDSISPIAPTIGFIQSLGKIIKPNTILIDIQESYIL